MPVENSNSAVREHLNIIRREWLEDSVSASTPWLSFPPAHITPRPKTLPHAPMYLATASQGGIEHAAAIGLPLRMPWHTTIDEKREAAGTYARVTRENGRNPHPEHVITGIGHWSPIP
jgi:alkanesulfonate monooxygenase SsuD/methylene tetrahydromethanopterin reductase-like flavin-dependent oxidoreductase (luciferase family)